MPGPEIAGKFEMGKTFSSAVPGGEKVPDPGTVNVARVPSAPTPSGEIAGYHDTTKNGPGKAADGNHRSLKVEGL